jgi:hypothetical protein
MLKTTRNGKKTSVIDPSVCGTLGVIHNLYGAILDPSKG